MKTAQQIYMADGVNARRRVLSISTVVAAAVAAVAIAGCDDCTSTPTYTCPPNSVDTSHYGDTGSGGERHPYQAPHYDIPKP